MEVIESARSHLEYQLEMGLEGLDRRELERARSAARERMGRTRENPAESLRRIKSELGDCRRCPLHKKRTNLVFGEGDPYARVMFVGEGPGADEDAQGLPFVGKAGKLLTDVIEKGMRLERAEVYIANVVKCRPPNNRDPEPEEMATCLPFLKKQIEAIKPRAIVALGRVAAHALLETEAPISRLRGNWHDLDGLKVMPTYHPSYLLRNPAAKRETWADIKKVMEYLGLPIEEKK